MTTSGPGAWPHHQDKTERDRAAGLLGRRAGGGGRAMTGGPAAVGLRPGYRRLHERVFILMAPPQRGHRDHGDGVRGDRGLAVERLEPVAEAEAAGA